MTTGLCVKAVCQLLYIPLLRISNADFKGGKRFRPIRFALLSIPVAAFGLKKYCSGTCRSSSRSDNEDSMTALGDSEVTTVKHSPRHAIPEFGQRPNDDRKISSFVGREEASNVLDEDKRGATVSNEPRKLEEQPRLCSVEPTSWSHSGKADVLAWESSGPNSCFWNVIGDHLSYVGRFRYGRPVLFEDLKAEGLQLALPDRFEPRSLEPQLEPADAGEEGGYGRRGRLVGEI